MELIDKNEVGAKIQAMYIRREMDYGGENEFCRGMRKALRIIEDAPTIEAEPVKQDTELSIILQDYGIKDTDTLRYILDQYQKIIVEITGGQMSDMTYPAQAVLYTPKKKRSKIRLEHKLIEESNGDIFEDIINDNLAHGWCIVDKNAKFIPNQGLIFTARLERIVEVNDE